MSHGSFCWNELMTHDVEKAKAFYSKSVGGIFPMDGAEYKGMEERWVSILAVDNIDARVKKATAAGAKVMKGPFDIPQVGRMAYVQEPGGAMIGWMTPVDTSCMAADEREPAAAAAR